MLNYPYLGVFSLICHDFTICAIFTLYIVVLKQNWHKSFFGGFDLDIPNFILPILFSRYDLRQMTCVIFVPVKMTYAKNAPANVSQLKHH